MPKLSTKIFAGVFPTGIQYADRTSLAGGDYKGLAFLSFETLELTVKPDCPPHLESEIRADAAQIQELRGQHYHISLSQTVILGQALG